MATQPGSSLSDLLIMKQIMLHVIALMVLVASGLAPAAEVAARKMGDTTVDPRALTIQGSFGQAINGKSFQQDALVTHGGIQYIAYYDEGRRVCVARRQLPAGAWDIIRFEDYDFQSNDAHNTISIGICPADGTIHLAFDHHNHPLHYRASRPGLAHDPEPSSWTAAGFGPIRDELEPGQPIRITYPRFLQTPDGGLQFFYRRGGSGNGDRMLVDYNPSSGSWSGTRQIDSSQGTYRDSTSRCSYPNGYTYGPDGRLHATWVWREGSQTGNHDLSYAYSDDRGRTWHNNAGDVLAAPAAVETPGLVAVTIDEGYGLMNTHGQAVDSRGRIHTVMWHCTDESLAAVGAKPGESRWGPEAARRYLHYWRDEQGRWHRNVLPGVAGTRPKLFIDPQDRAYLIFNGGDDLNPNRGENLKIATAGADALWSDWSIIHTEPGPFGNEMLGDPQRWAAEGILSVLVQGQPAEAHAPTPLRVLDFAFTSKP